MDAISSIPTAVTHKPIQLEKVLDRIVTSGSSDIIVSENKGGWVIKHGSVEPIKELGVQEMRTLYQAVLEVIGVDGKALSHSAIETSVFLANHRFRVSAFNEIEGGRIVLRVLSEKIPTPTDINMPVQLLESGTRLSQGLILICGPTGCGKTTTIACILAERARQRREHVVTLEDPVEYVLPQDLPTVFSQREVGKDEPTFAKGLKAALRQSPHVIVIGEIRDTETAVTALEAAETGHLVIATIHATSADITAQRYIQMVEPERQDMVREQLAINTELIVCQRLCRAERGHRGRVAIHELMLKTHATANCIRKSQWSELRNELVYGGKKGHITFERSIKNLQEAGKITANELAEMMAWLKPLE